MKTLTPSQLLEILLQLHNQLDIELKYLSEVKLRKGAPYKKVLKRAKYKGVINKSHHQAEVDRILELGTKDVLEVPQARSWGIPIPGTPVVEWKGKNYLSMTEVEETSIIFLTIESGEQVEVSEWVYEKPSIVKTRNFELCHKILAIKIGDTPYLIRGDDDN